MLNAFVWMFRKKEFAKHFFYLMFFIFMALALTIASTKNLFAFNNNLALAMEFLPFVIYFVLMGYFWDLSSEIIERERDVEASSVYNKRVSIKYNFEMPSLNFIKLAWRGFSSIVASVLIPIPYLILFYISSSSGHYDSLPTWVKIFSLGLFVSFAPALYWNYAKTNSVFATLNIAKAVFVMGNYTFRYISIVFVWLLLLLANFYVDSIIYNYVSVAHDINLISISILCLMSFLFIFKTAYLIFVHAYILGSLVPASEF